MRTIFIGIVRVMYDCISFIEKWSKSEKIELRFKKTEKNWILCKLKKIEHRKIKVAKLSKKR